ncbi:anti-virulence regulator CigR family protein [Pseudomonas sp. Gutcm_11s]|uniref:anti-virulence regulator CigR family protein n=1 Tax=Pseudomonas sp. Gutcm_11s TaxID=3026088 RepID=UPI0023603EDB|nr:anti-virulence regulator CigR family protein [Pseudomonas sp. Gutcm_11s]MDD0844865.1 anti-virulence regulator CigR family protein [Pseudomonas sp. Gutcm_11s]
MKQPHPAFALLGLFLIGSSSLLDAHAAPQNPPEQRQEQHQEPRGRQDQQRPQQPGQGSAQQQRPPQQQAQQRPSNDHHQAPPRNFADVHRAFHERRAQIGRGPAVPPGVHIRQGQPLPPGYGKRLDERALHGLPHYAGYEWRRVGSDVVLITVTTGIVYTILQGVLN